MSLQWSELKGLPPNSLQKVLLDELRVIMSAEASAEHEDERLAGLAAPLRVLWLLNWLDFEVAQGGLLAYLTNSHGRHAAQAGAALREIGAPAMAAVLDAAAAELGDGSPEPDASPSPEPDASSPEPDASSPEPDASSPEPERDRYVEVLADLDDRYELAAETDGWGDKLDAFPIRAVAAQAGI
ncbi:hypothetical protein MB27_09490 [Actinoplanes utahensis]|uniref:DNA mimic protein DMP19 C-terminal domain-containing protein n=1 Tax=Actinoplanes utahensis TaxID=1869 RepID=A0A0A6UTA9_ACTUT|nr:hypothetical protein MB27_09490 [Actinoplanes utahensis]